MSGLPNVQQITRVVLIGRTLKGLQDEAEEIRAEIARLKARNERINSSWCTLTNERDKLLTAMDVHPAQRGNYGYEAHYEAFLNIMATVNAVGKADEPE